MNPKKELFDKKKYILDPYAKAVIGQSGWGKNRSMRVFIRQEL